MRNSTFTASRRFPHVASLKRIAAAVAAMVLLLGASLISVGGVLLAPVAMFILYRVRRRQRSGMTMFGSWFAACVGVALAYLILAAFLVRSTPENSWSKMQTSMDSAQAISAQKPRPEWLERLASRNHTAPVLPLQAFKPGIGFMIIGGLLMINVMSALIGSIGWGCAILLWYAATQRRPWESFPLEQTSTNSSSS
jgi:hypothetical protein